MVILEQVGTTRQIGGRAKIGDTLVWQVLNRTDTGEKNQPSDK